MVPRTHNQTMYNGGGNTLKTTGQHREPLSPQPPRPGHPTQPLTTPPRSAKRRLTHPSPPRPQWEGRGVLHRPQHGQLWCCIRLVQGACGHLVQGALLAPVLLELLRLF